MKRIAIVMAAFFCLLCAILTFTGCAEHTPITFDSVLSINADESGVRTITATADKETLDAIFGTKNTAFQHFLTLSCPESMSWSHVETGRTYELTFTIPFDSLEQYQNKVGALTGVSDSVVITRPKVGVKAGFTLTESTNTADLFTWLVDALRERTNTKASKLNSLLVNGTNRLYYANREFEQPATGLYVYAETLLNAECIDILTEVSHDDVWNRTVYIRFPVAMLENAVNVKPYLSSLLPDGIEETWLYDTVWQLTFAESTEEELLSRMNILFQARSKGQLSEEIVADNPMQISHHYSESLNVGFFVPNADKNDTGTKTGEPRTGTTRVRYFVKTKEEAELSVLSPDDAIREGQDGVNDYPDYTCLYIQRLADGTFDYTATYQYQPLEMCIDTAVISSQDFRRSTTLEMGYTPPENHRKLILEALTQKAQGHGNISEEENNGLYRIIFKQSGTGSQINDGFTAVFGGTAKFSYERGAFSLLAKEIPVSFTDRIELQSFLAVPANTLLTYHLTLPDGELTDGDVSSVTRLTTDGICEVSGTALRPNKVRPWFIAFAVFAVLLIVVLALNGPIKGYLQAQRRQTRRQTSRRYPAKKTGSRQGSSKRTAGNRQQGSSKQTKGSKRQTSKR